MVFSDVFIIIWILVFMFSMDIPLSLVTLSVLPVLIYGTFLFRKKVRETYRDVRFHLARLNSYMQEHVTGCLLYTSDAADERSSVDLGGRRIIKKNKIQAIFGGRRR